MLDGGTIIVADGLYSGENNRNIMILNKQIHFQSVNGPDQTIIDCGHAGYALNLGGILTVDGFTVINGNSLTGAIMAGSSADLTISNCRFLNNTGTKGGALSSGGNAQIAVKNSSFVHNSAAEDGGAIFNGGIYGAAELTLTNCEFIDNQAGNHGGAIANSAIPNSPDNVNASANVVVSHSTFINNSAGGSGDAIWSHGDPGFSASVSIINSIARGSDMQIIHSGDTTTEVTYSNIQNGPVGVGNIDTDPLFSLANDPHLINGSPCIDTGLTSSSIPLPSADLDNNDRVLDGDNDGVAVVDMGAYEYDSSGSPVIAASPGAVNFTSVKNTRQAEDQVLSLTNAGSGDFSWQGSENCSWLETSFLGTTDGLSEILLSADDSEMEIGSHICFLTLTEPNALNSPRNIPVILTVRAPLYVEPGGLLSTIQAGIDAAESGETVVVKTGLYQGTGNVQLSFDGSKAITLTCESDPEDCIIDGQDYSWGIIFSDGVSDNSILEGFTIRNTTGAIGISANASPTIRNCIVENNQAINSGAGISIGSGSTATIINTVITGNQANTTGGGIYCSTDSAPAIVNTIFTDNISFGQGGGIFIEAGATPVITNSTLYGNISNTGGGGIYIHPDANPVITNSIIWANNSDNVAGQADALITYSDIEGGYPGSGNIDSDPGFYDPSANNYRFPQDSDSLCIDSGNNDAPSLASEDKDGKDRIIDGQVDMGVFENGAEISGFSIDLIPDLTFYPGDPLEFYASSDNWSTVTNSEIEYSYVLSSGEPSGIITIDSDTGLFRYTPPEAASGDTAEKWRPFSVIIIARNIQNNEIDEQIVYFNSSFDLSGEELVLSEIPLDDTNMPDEEDDKYVVIQEVKSKDKRRFNHLNLYVRTIEISGKTLVVDSDSALESNENNLYQYHEEKDIEYMSIYAETLIIRDTLKLPGTNVTIFVRHLVFEGEAALIKTTPLPNEAFTEYTAIEGCSRTVWSDPEHAIETKYDEDFCKAIWHYNDTSDLTFVQDGIDLTGVDHFEECYKIVCDPFCEKETEPPSSCQNSYDVSQRAYLDFTIVPGDGHTGLKGGNVTLYAETLNVDDQSVGTLFDLTGGKGQKAGEGRPGLDGLSLETVSLNYPFTFMTSYSGNAYGCLGAVSIDNLDEPNENWTPANTIYLQYCHPYLPHIYQDLNPKNEGIWPGDGSDALPAGSSGIGGNGGGFDTNATYQIQDYIDISGGPHGSGASTQKGGEKGTPQMAVKVNFFVICDGDCNDSPNGSIKVYGPTTQAGNDALPPPVSPNGQVGTSTISGHFYSWLHPFALKVILAHAEDAYLYGYRDEAKALLVDYPSAIDEFMTAEPESTLIGELMQIRDEIVTVLHRIDNHLDFFGNPVGWTPMLSFEITKDVFDKEIKDSFQVFYLANMVKNAQEKLADSRQALTMTKEKLSQQINDAIDEYKNAVHPTDGVLARAAQQADEISGIISSLIKALQSKSSELKTVETIMGGADKAIGVLTGLTACIPKVGGAISKTGEFATTLAKQIPLEPEIVAGMYGYLNDHLPGMKIDAKEVEDALDDSSYTLVELQGKAGKISKGLVTVSKLLTKQEMAETEVVEMLKQMRSTYPELAALIKDVSALLVKKIKLANLVAETQQKIATLPGRIIEKRLMIEDIDNTLTLQGNVAPSLKTIMYVSSMEQRAKANLIKYHYYMAKAYEYRRLEKYPGRLNLEGVVGDLNALLSWESPSYDLDLLDFSVAKTTYQGVINEVEDQILDEYLARTNEDEWSGYNEYSLSTAEIQQLNDLSDQGIGSITLNLVEAIRHLDNKENIRITDLQISTVVLPEAEVSFGDEGTIEFRLMHSGVSRLTKNGETYLFQHVSGAAADSSILQWVSTYNYRDEDMYSFIIDNGLSKASNSLLSSLLDPEDPAQTDPDYALIYSRPAAATDLIVTMEKIIQKGDPIAEVLGLTITLFYDYVFQNPDILDPDFFDLDVRVSPDEIIPYFSVAPLDRQQRSDALGSFHRSYDPGMSVTVSTFERHGTWVFEGWTDVLGSDIGLDPDNPLLVTVLNNNLIATANFFHDQDYDSLADDWEEDKFGDTGTSDGSQDSDGDGLSDLAEFKAGTNPNSKDTDGDGMPDGWEISFDLNPIVDDALDDADDDGSCNLCELLSDTNPQDATSLPVITSNVEEFETGDFSRFPWVQSGDGLWEVTGVDPLKGAFSVVGPQIGDEQTATLEISMYCDPGYISFWLMVDSEVCNGFCDGLEFYIDGAPPETWSGDKTLSQETYPVTGGWHTFTWSYIKDGSYSEGSDSAWLDDISFPVTPDTDKDSMPDSWEEQYYPELSPLMDDAQDDPDDDGFSNLREFIARTNPTEDQDFPIAAPIIEDFETGDLNKLPWRTNGDDDWAVTTSSPSGGDYAGESPAGLPDNYGIASIETKLYSDGGDISFWFMVDSEENYDHLRFYIDDVEQGAWSGNMTYAQETFEVTMGMHSFKWVYDKNKNTAAGFDAAWIDDIMFPGGVDSDNDGMPDGWEIEYGLKPLFIDKLGDADKDGIPNIDEYVNGTNPVPLCGDVSDDTLVDLEDMILVLQILSGGDNDIRAAGDCNNDGRIDMKEGIKILRTISQ